MYQLPIYYEYNYWKHNWFHSKIIDKNYVREFHTKENSTGGHPGIMTLCHRIAVKDNFKGNYKLIFDYSQTGTFAHTWVRRLKRI